MVKKYTYWVLQNLTSDNRSSKVPVMITRHLKHEAIFGLNFLKTSNAIINFADIKISVIYFSPYALIFKYLFYRYELICNRQTVVSFMITYPRKHHTSYENDEITSDDLITSTTCSFLRVHTLLSQFSQKANKQLLVLLWTIPKVPSTTLNTTRPATLCIPSNISTVLK